MGRDREVTPVHAIILAGGKGERLRPFTEDRPKPMVEVLGIPILGYQIQWLQAQGVTDIVIACGYRHQVIQDYFDDGEKWGVRIRYSVESTPLGRGGALRQAMQMITPDDVCIATNGDIITNLRIAALITMHQETDNLATVVLIPYTSSYGVVEVDSDGKIVAFVEKPELPHWINAGIYALSPKVLPLLPERGDHEQTTFPRLAGERRLGAFKSRAYWRAVDTVKDLSEVAKELERRLLTAFLE
ncbi:MAG: nucleotidyltransferase family protein [Armatimonadetes bacterium]|nr:nucleotidyltransferase family protein [Armatimonadota bacterium]